MLSSVGVGERRGVQPAAGPAGGDRQRTAAVRIAAARVSNRRRQRADARRPRRARRRSRRFSRAWCPTNPMRSCEALHAEADVVIVSGGSSVGIEDLAPTLVARHGELAIHGIAMRPSSPTGLGRIGHRLVFLLPGNPVSCLCAYDFFAGRAIRALGGRSKAWPYRSIRARLTRKISSPIGRLDYARVQMVDGRRRAARRRRRVGAVVDHARRRLRHRPRRQRGLRARHRGGGLALCLSRSSFSTSSTATRRSAAFARRSTSRRAASKRCRSTPRSAACWRPTSSRRSTCRRSTARTSMASPSSPKTRSARPRKCRARCELGEETIHTGVVPTTVIRPGTAVSIATGGMVPRGADAVVMVEYAEVARPRAADRQSGHGGKRRVVRRNRHHRGRDRAAPWPAADQPRYRRAGRDRRRGRRRLAQADRRHPLDRRRDHRSRRADAAGQGLRLERPGARRRRARARRRADAAGDCPRRHGRPAGKASARPRVCRRRAALRRHEQGRGRSVVSRRRRTARSRDRRARRGAQARQADLPGGDSRPPGGRAPGLSDVGDFHVSRVRRAGASPAGRSGRAGANRGAGPIGGQGQQRDRPHGVPAGRAGRNGGRARAERRSPRIRWDRDPAASRRSAAPTASRRSAGTKRSSRRARSSTFSCSAATCSWPTSS